MYNTGSWDQMAAELVQVDHICQRGHQGDSIFVPVSIYANKEM